MKLTPSNHNIDDLNVEIWRKNFLDLAMDSQTVKKKPAELCQHGEINGKGQETAQSLQNMQTIDVIKSKKVASVTFDDNIDKYL